MAEPETTTDTPITAEPVPVASAPVARRRLGSAGWLVLGGVIAAGLGFGVAKLLPGGWPQQDTQALVTQVQSLTGDVAALKSRVEDLAKQPAADPALADRLAALESRPGTPDLSAQIAALEEQVRGMAALPGSTDAAALKALQDQVTALAASPASVPAEVDAAVKAAKDQLAAATAEAEAQAKTLLSTSALHEIAAAMDSGAPFSAALSNLPQDAVPQILTGHAQSGLPTLQALRDTFPEAARAALEASRRADMGTGWADRITTFLQTQTGARSLAPRDGTDPDAVLSRAEAKLKTGELAAAVAELAALPDVAKAALADWSANAQLRLDSEAALSELGKAMGN